MRIVILSSSIYSETACAMALRVSRAGYPPVGALAIRTLDRGTVLRKLGQWGASGVTRYARNKILPPRLDAQPHVSNPYLEPTLKPDHRLFRNLREVAAANGFPIATCNDQNAPDAITRLKAWSPDLIIFTGGNILRKQLLEVPRLGVLNVHLGLLPEIRGMSSPEWSLLQNVPIGITIHFIDAGIDTGPILQKYELPDAARSTSLNDLRNRLIALGVEKMGEVITSLDHGTISSRPQSGPDRDSQYFVMHEWLQNQATLRLKTATSPAEKVHG